MPDCRLILHASYGAHPRQRYDLVVPEGSEDTALVILVHGGWFTGGRHEDLRALALVLAEHGIASAAIGLRHLGDGPRDGQDLTADLREAVTAVLDAATVYGMDGHSLILLGSGSGSLTALVAASQLTDDPKRRVRAAIACGVTPTLDHTDGVAPQLGRILDTFAGTHRHTLSPMHLRPDSFPPLLLIHGDADTDIPAKIVHRFHLRVSESGESSTLAVLSGAPHHFIELPYDRSGKAALERIIPFAREHGRNPDATLVRGGSVPDIAPP